MPGVRDEESIPSCERRRAAPRRSSAFLGSSFRRAATMLCVVLSLLVSQAARAKDAEDELGTWLIYNGTIRFSDRWSVFTEAQLRLWEVSSNPQEVFGRAIGQYHLWPDTAVGVGYTLVRTEPFADEKPVGTENRMIEQISKQDKWRSTTFQHRGRFEQRWLRESGETNYRNRFRYRLQVTTPLWRDTIEPGTHFLNFYDEVFLHFADDEDGFDQNRLYGAYGYQLSRLANLQLGLLWQAKRSENFLRLQIFLTHNFDLGGSS